MHTSTVVAALFSLTLVGVGGVGAGSAGVEAGGGRGDPFALIKRQRNGRGGGRFAGLRQQLDGKLDPGNRAGQGQGTTNPAGTGSQQTNSTSGLPDGIVDTGDPQKNLFLDPSQIAKGLAQDGTSGAGSEAGVVASATSVNNFINACLLRTDLPLTNGNQVKTGSCNAVPMGVIAAQTKMPSCKFVNPKNLDTIPPNQDFTVQMAINNLVTGNFVNAQQTPQNVDQNGVIIGHSHIVIEPIDSLTTTTVSDPTQFAFFKGLNDAAQNGVLSATVTGGLPAGTYKLSSINSAANHQPALVGVAQHGSLDDAVYFTVADNANAASSDGNVNGGSNRNSNGNNAGQTQGQAQAQTASTAAAAGNNNVGQGQRQAQATATTTTAAVNNVGQGQAQVAASSSSATSTLAGANIGQGQAQVPPTTTTSAAGQQGQGRFGGFAGRNGRNGGAGRNGSNNASTSSSSATSTASLAARSALSKTHSNTLSQRRHTNRALDSKYKLEKRLEALVQAQQRA